jgi:predicted Zn-dependent protease with MMP-like domain
MSSLPPRFGLAPSAADLDALGRAALAAIPSPFADHLPQIVFQVEDFADDTTLAELGDSAARGGQPDMIFLYRQPLLLEWCETDETLEDIVTHLIIHEVGHHFGLSDDDMHRIEDQC